MSLSGKKGLSVGKKPAFSDDGRLPAAGRKRAVKGYRGGAERKGEAAARRARTGGAVRARDGRKLAWSASRNRGEARRPKRPPRYWRPLVPVLSPGAPVPERRLNGWLLVLEAKKIPHVFFPDGDCPFLYVPPLHEGVAVHEILAFEGERPRPFFESPARKNAAGVLFFLLLLVAWHGLRWNWFDPRLPSPPFPSSAEAWPGLFGLDVYRVRALHEWWRTVTALTLHADGPHLFSNLIFGLFFFIPLCRRAGLGLGMALAFAAGVLGNAGNALIREAHVLSLGFSTALFGAVGGLCALNAADVVRFSRFSTRRIPGLSLSASDIESALFPALLRRLGVPLAAGLALLGILGGGGEARTDYAAHIWGFGCGLLCALVVLPLERARFSPSAARRNVAQAMLCMGVLAAISAAWSYALFR